MRIESDGGGAVTGGTASASAAAGEIAKSAQNPAVEEEAGSSERRPRRERGSDGSGMLETVNMFRSQAKTFRAQADQAEAKGEPPRVAENLRARADRADAAADRIGAGYERKTGESAPAAPKDDAGEAGNSGQALAKEMDVDVEAAGTAFVANEGAAAAANVMKEEEEREMEERMAAEGGSGGGSQPASTPQEKRSDGGDGGRRDSSAANSGEQAKDETEGATATASAASAGPDRSARKVSGSITLDATEARRSGNWRQTKVGGETAMLWDAPKSNYNAVDDGEKLSFSISPTESGSFGINMRSARVKSAMSSDEAIHKDRGNDIYFRVKDADTGEVVMPSTKLFTYFGNTSGEFKNGNQFDYHGTVKNASVDLKAGKNYEIEVIGRSDGYAVQSMSLNKR